MAINNITFNLGQGALGRVAPGQDYISGYTIYSNSVPSGFTSGVAQEIFSLSQAESLGIVGDFSDETKATAKLVVGNTASLGDQVAIEIDAPAIGNYGGTSFITYTVQSSDFNGSTFSSSLMAGNLVNAINASGTGFSATSTGATVSLVAAPGYGISLNSAGVLYTKYNIGGSWFIGSPIVSVNSDFTGGVASSKAIWHYQISEFFRINPNGLLWVGFFPTGTTTFSEITNMQSQASGSIRQFMLASSATQSSVMLTEIDKLQTQGVAMFQNYTPASIVYAFNTSGISDLSTMPNIRAKSDNYVSVCIGQDAGGLGAWLAKTTGKSCSVKGALLGAISLAAVDEDIAWVQKFNISDGVEDETIGFGNGQSWNTLYGTLKSLLVQLDNYGYIFLKKVNNISGSYFNDSHCAISVTSDYAYIENNRTIDKAVRNVYLELAPMIAGPIYFNADGTLADVTVFSFQNNTKPSLDAMVGAGEISAYKVVVDRNQKVQQTGVVVLTIQIVGVGVARNITVNIGYALSI
jgi:hypothetical protein